MNRFSKGLATARDEVLGRSVLDPEIATPLMVIRASAMDRNIALMAAFCRREGVELAPHAKTTMSPEIVRRQLDAGAWAITVANVSQAIALGADAGPRILIANEVVDPAGIGWLAKAVRDGRPEVCCYVDSLEGARRLAAAVTTGVLPVLLELGFVGGRGGVRTRAAAVALAREIRTMPSLRLAGVAGFEGFLGVDREPATVEKVRGFLSELHALAGDLVAEALVDAERELILSAGGSAYFDLVVEALKKPLAGARTRVVLRSGCYVTHDHGAYVDVTPFRTPGAAFEPAIQLLSSVLSRPEPGLAICDIGRRDAPFDAGLPIPLQVRPAKGGMFRPVKPGALEVTRLNDQHAYVAVAGETLEVGDVLSFGVSHPCTAFDKWRVIPIVDDDLRVVQLAHTRF